MYWIRWSTVSWKSAEYERLRKYPQIYSFTLPERISRSSKNMRRFRMFIFLLRRIGLGCRRLANTSDKVKNIFRA